MRTSWLRRRFALFGCAALAACAAGLEGGPAVPGEGGVHRAALATVTVDNRTDRPLSIAFRSVEGPDREVVIGGVAGLSRATLAPVLAGEPIVLVARTPGGAEYRLGAKSLEIDAEWVWVIPADAEFVVPGTRDGGA